jgi:hypothetical protein
MRFAYKVWHSEQDKWAAKKEGGRPLDDDQIVFAHQRIEELVRVNYASEPAFTASVVMLHPVLKGVLIVLHSNASEGEADLSLARCLVRINSMDPDLCLVAEPLPDSREVARPSLLSQLDMLSTRASPI